MVHRHKKRNFDSNHLTSDYTGMLTNDLRASFTIMRSDNLKLPKSGPLHCQDCTRGRHVVDKNTKCTQRMDLQITKC